MSGAGINATGLPFAAGWGADITNQLQSSIGSFSMLNNQVATTSQSTGL